MPVSDSGVVTAMSRKRRTLGILWATYGLVCLLKVAWIVVNASDFTLMWGALLNRVPNPYPWMTLFHVVLIGAVALLIVAAGFSFLAAVALLQHAESGRVVTLMASVLGIISGPLGIALGVYTLILLLARQASETHHSFAAAA